MNGTEWVQPGQGATARALALAIVSADGRLTTGAQIESSDVSMRHLRNISDGLRDKRMTNLRLTGEPLTAEDLRRIAVAK